MIPTLPDAKQWQIELRLPNDVDDNPEQAHLFGQAQNEELLPVTKKAVKGYAYSNKQKDANNVNDTGLWFTDDVPTKVIHVPCPELEGEDAENYEVIGNKETHRLAQMPCCYQVLIYRKKVLLKVICV